MSLLSVIPVIVRQALTAHRQHKLQEHRTTDRTVSKLESAPRYAVQMRRNAGEITIRVSFARLAVTIGGQLPRATSGTETDPIVARSEQESKIVSNMLRLAGDDLQDQANKIIVRDPEASADR